MTARLWKWAGQEYVAASDYDALAARLAEAERDKEHLQRAVDRACQVMREDVLTQDLDGTTTARVNLFLATYGTPVSASLAQE